MGTNLRVKKQHWFDLGAANFAIVRPGASEVPAYPCPICLELFPRDALDDGRLTAEDVPLRSLGGRPLLLTCKSCNNTSGTTIDADAKDHENLREAIAGKATRRAVISVWGRQVRGDVDLGKGQFRMRGENNPPGTLEFLQQKAARGTQLQLNTKPRSELGKNISWLKAGYLVLVAEYGFNIAFDPAMAIVRKQILEIEERKMVTFLREDKQDVPVSRRATCRVLAPRDHNGWVVILGRFALDYPLKGDMTFYDRLAHHAGLSTTSTLKVMATPTAACFGFAPGSPTEEF